MSEHITNNSKESLSNSNSDEENNKIKIPRTRTSPPDHGYESCFKKHEEMVENNTDSNKSGFVFQTPSNITSSSVSIKNEIDYSTPQSNKNNFDLNFNKLISTASQKRNLNTLDSPFINNKFSYINFSPFLESRVNCNFPPQNIFSNNLSNNTLTPSNFVFQNEGSMSINIQHKHFYPKVEGELPSSFSRKIEFPQKNSAFEKNLDSSDSHDDLVKKPQPISLSAGSNSLNSLNSMSKSNDSIIRHTFNGFTTPMSVGFLNAKFNQNEEKLKEELSKKKNFCNCKKSKCLKLYCECFANGEKCVNCNCTDCSNVIGNEKEIKEVFQSAKDKNPAAMKLSNIDSVKEDVIDTTKVGCNCTKSNCQKKYCECFKLGNECTDLCRCVGCHNLNKKGKKLKNEAKVNERIKNIYNDYEIEKISILIENSEIKVEMNKIKNFNYSQNNFIIEVSKSILNNEIYSLTPKDNKLIKRKRDRSQESKDSNSMSDYNLRLTRTACESHKKNTFNDVESLNIKKLSMDSRKGKESF